MLVLTSNGSWLDMIVAALGVRVRSIGDWGPLNKTRRLSFVTQVYSYCKIVGCETRQGRIKRGDIRQRPESQHLSC